MFAKEIMTIDDISNGRLVCGIGSGGTDRDILLRKEISRAQWADRFAEFVELTDLLLRQAHANPPPRGLLVFKTHCPAAHQKSRALR